MTIDAKLHINGYFFHDYVFGGYLAVTFLASDLRLHVPRVAEKHEVREAVHASGGRELPVRGQRRQSHNCRAFGLYGTVAHHALRGGGKPGPLLRIHRRVAVSARQLERRVGFMAEPDGVPGRRYGKE
jgi:hypothetical protein